MVLRTALWVWVAASHCTTTRTTASKNCAASSEVVMANSWQEGKDQTIFVTKEDHETLSSAELVVEDPNDPFPFEGQGLLLPGGVINWDCQCLGGMANGPCGEQFKSVVSCFLYSTEETKGSDCVNQYLAMQECMQKYPDLYPEEGEEEEEKVAESKEKGAPPEASTT